MIRTAVLSVQDSTAAVGTGDAAVAAVREILATGPYIEVDYQQVPDEQAIVRARLRLWADDGSADLVLTLGGIGAAIRHRTPDATLEVVERQFPGIPEALRAAGATVDPSAGLWRTAAGVRRGTLVVNLPDEPRSVHVVLTAVSGLLVSAVRSICG
ncbi:MAG: molybdopterin-binding protein [Trueperaceae bacterium]